MELEEKFEYIVNFSELISTAKKKEIASQYYSKCKKIYNEYFARESNLSECCLGIRVYRAKKEMFCSAQMFSEAEVARENGCLTAYYFLCYYALFHAMQCILFFNTYITNDKIVQLTHANVGKYFKEYYCKGKKPILEPQIIEEFERLKLFREFYSYTMPFNSCGVESIDLNKVKKYLRLCYQFASLHSHILYQAKTGTHINEKERMNIITFFINCCCKLNPDNKKLLLDYADNSAINEFLECGISFAPMTITFDHDYDEFGGYDGEYLNDMGITDVNNIRSKALSLIYTTIY